MTLSSPANPPTQLPLLGRAAFRRGWWLALLLLLLSGLNALAQSAPTLSVTPSSVTLRQIVTAQSSGLDTTLTYTLDWGDGSTDSLTGSTSAQSIHNYRQAGTYTARLSASGLPPAVATITVTQPVPTVSATPSGLNATLNLGNLLIDFPYDTDSE